MSSLVFFLVYKYILSLLVNLQDLLVKWNIFLGIVSPKLRMNQLKKYNEIEVLYKFFEYAQILHDVFLLDCFNQNIVGNIKFKFFKHKVYEEK